MDMYSIDDDFGDLYAEVEVQASSVLHGILESTKLQSEPENTSNYITTDVPSSAEGSRSETKKIVPVTFYANNGAAQNAASCGVEASDSDDDLNIVLNDKDCEVSPATGGSNGEFEEREGVGYGVGTEVNISGRKRKLNDGFENGGDNSKYSQNKCVVSQGYKRMSSSASTLAGGGSSNDEGNEIQNSRLNQISCIRTDLDVAVPRGGYGFSLPRYRTIFDVKIDAFEKKPWTYPGADLTDFFNFGLDEMSWKDYCRSVKRVWEGRSPQSRLLLQKFDKDIKEDFKDNSQGEPSSRSASGEEELQRRAIHVENSMVERIPSMDKRRPRNWDSDVVIQITGCESTGGSSGLGKEELGHINNKIEELSKHENSYSEDYNNTHFSGSSGGEELSGISATDAVTTPDESSGLGRVSGPVISSDQMPFDADKQQNGKMPTINESEHATKNASSPTKTAKGLNVIDITGKEFHKDADTVDCMIETESFLGDQFLSSPSPSCSVGDCVASELSQSESSEGTTPGDQLEINSSSRKTEAQEFDMSDNLNCRQSPILEKQRHHSSKPCFASQEESKGESYEDAFCISKSEVGRRHYGRRGSPFCGYGRSCSSRMRATYKREGNDNRASRSANVKRLNDRDYVASDYSRWKERVQRYGYHNIEESSYYRVRASFSGYEDGRSSEEHVKIGYSNCRARSPWNSREGVDRFVQYNCDERRHSHRRSIVQDEKCKRPGRDWCYSRRGPSSENMNPLLYREHRFLSSGHPFYYERQDDKWRREDENIRFGNGSDYDGHMQYQGHEKDLMREKYWTSRSADREEDSFIGTHAREFPAFERQEFSGRSGCDNAPKIYQDGFYSSEANDQYRRNTSGRNPSYLLLQESFSPNDARVNDWRNDSTQVSEECGSYRSQICDQEGGGGWMGGLSNALGSDNCFTYENDRFFYENDQVPCNRYSLKYGGRGWVKDQIYYDREPFTDEALVPSRRISTHDRSAGHRYSQDNVHTDKVQRGNYRYKMRKENDCSSYSRNIVMLHRDEHEQKLQRSRDSRDLIGGKSKLEGRKAGDRRLGRNSGEIKMDKRFGRVSDESGEIEAFRRDTRSIESNKHNEKYLCNFLLPEQNADMDIEEGQILEETSRWNEPNSKSASHAEAQSLKQAVHPEKVCDGSNSEIGKQQILETLAKMEKRRERFKEPIAAKKELNTNSEHQAEPRPDIVGMQQQRPARKRRWGSQIG